jgi:hypothetical protein
MISISRATGSCGFCAISAVIVAALGCSGQHVTPGQLILSIESDMALPDQIDTIRIEVLVRGALYFGNDYEVGENALLMPATLTLVAGDGPPTPVLVRVIGKKGTRTRTLRETTTTVPEGRVAFLPMPVQWLCDDAVMPGAQGDVVSTCGDGYTCSGGRCVERDVPETELLDYTPELVYGGAPTPEEGQCFDTLNCMALGAVAEPDDQCTIAKPHGGLGINVALRVLNDGICDEASGACFVPLHADNDDGFRELNDRLQLPGAVCDRLRAGRVSAVVVSTTCATRSAASPACGSWSSVRVPPPLPPEQESKPPPLPSVVAQIADEDRSVCCPLLADSRQFYSCLCDEAGHLKVVALDLDGGPAVEVASFTPLDRRPAYPATLIDDTLYWVDREVSVDNRTDAVIRATFLSDGTTRAVTRFSGDIFDDAMLLADSSTLYALAPLVGDEGDEAQIVAVTRSSGETRFLSVGARWVGFEFAQDDSSLYVTATSRETTRSSRIERVSKIDGTRETISEIEVDEGDDNTGYSGLVLDGARLVAVSMDPQGNGSLEASLLALDSRGDSKVLYSQSVEAQRARLRPLGVSDGVVLLGRWQLATSSDNSTLDSSSVLLVPDDGNLPRVLAEFLRDGPVGQMQAPPFDATAVYWLNSSGRLYRLARATLRF